MQLADLLEQFDGLVRRKLQVVDVVASGAVFGPVVVAELGLDEVRAEESVAHERARQPVKSSAKVDFMTSISDLFLETVKTMSFEIIYSVISKSCVARKMLTVQCGPLARSPAAGGAEGQGLKSPVTRAHLEIRFRAFTYGFVLVGWHRIRSCACQTGFNSHSIF